MEFASRWTSLMSIPAELLTDLDRSRHSSRSRLDYSWPRSGPRIADLTEFLPCQGLEARDLDLGELVHRDDVLDGFELIRLDLLPTALIPRPV